MGDLIARINDIVWSPALVVLLVATGLYFSVRSRFVQLRRLPDMLHLISPKHGKKDGGISSFEAFCITLSGRVGTGNIVGVAMAIAIGGPGAVFWMWIVAFLGASTAFVESTLSQVYRFDYKGILRGGPFSYISEGLHCRWLAVIFAVVTIIGSGLFCSTVQANGVSGALSNAFGIPPLWSGLGLALLIALVIIGGIKRISKVASVITPFMAFGYIIIAFVVLAVNWRDIPAAFSCIFTNAFGINPMCGGILGSTISMGVKRGLFSNEAGQGTGAIPSASASVDHPAEQGLAQAFSVYIDTLLVCTATALMIICSGCYNIISPDTQELLVSNCPELAGNYVSYTQAAVDSVFAGFGSSFISISLVFFVFTTLMAYYLYSESSIIYLFKDSDERLARIVIDLFKVFFLAAIIFGSLREADFVWALADLGVGSMAWVNVICILILSPVAFRALKEYDDMHRSR